MLNISQENRYRMTQLPLGQDEVGIGRCERETCDIDISGWVGVFTGEEGIGPLNVRNPIMSNLMMF